MCQPFLRAYVNPPLDLSPADRVLFKSPMGRSLIGRIRLLCDTWALVDCERIKLPLLIERSRVQSVLDKAPEPATLPTS